ncbi:hypothetical protein BY996DRAFT_8489021 [Phakopsora pachyrhizi]|nr:hypothetical protein BY996DRAFT_8489021 [Phakopsora pachyrhizi]
MDPLENNIPIPSPKFPCPTVSLLRPISSPSAFVNTNIGCVTEHNEMQQDDNSNNNSEDKDEEEEEEEEEEEDEHEREENNPNEVNTTVKNQNAISVTMSDTQQHASRILNNYQVTSTESETNPVDINMEANQDPIFYGEIEVISKEAFLKNITVANRHLSLVIDNPSLSLYIRGKVKEAIDLLRVDEETAPVSSSGPDNNVLMVENSGIIPDSHSIHINNPEIQAPQALVEAQFPSQGDTLSIPETPTSSSTLLNTGNLSDLAINTDVIPEVQLPVPVPVPCLSKFFLQHEDVLIATLGNIYHSKSSSWRITLGSILALVKNRNSRIEGVDLPNYLPSGIEIKSDYGTSISQWLRHLEDAGLDMFLAKSNEPFFSEEILNTTMLLDSNTPVGHLPKNIHDIVYIMRPICNPPIAQQRIWANLLFESLHLVARDIIAPVKFVPQQVTTENPLSVEYALAGFLASCFSFNKNRGAILPMEGCKANNNTIKDPASGTFKNLDDFVDKIVHVLIAINMVQAYAKCQDNPAGPSSSIHTKRKGKASSSSIETVSSKTLQLVYKEIGLERPLYCLLMAFCAAGVRGLMLGSNNWRKCGALESLQIITLSNEILKLKGNDFEEPYWPRTSKYILEIIKSCFIPADPKSHKPMCPSRYEIAKCIVLDFGDIWHSKVDDSRKQHLSLPRKALVNAVISELS